MTRHRHIRLLVGVAATSALAAGLLAAPAEAVPQGSVKGVVTVEGKPLKGAKVSLMRTDDDSADAYDTYKTVTTGADGRYSFSNFERKGFIFNHVLVSDPQGRAVTDTREFKTTTKNVTRNVSLKLAGSIVGKVTRADGSSPAGTRVRIEGPTVLLDQSGNEDLAYDDDRGVSADGTYRFKGLPAGTYTIRYDDTAGTYLSECYDGVLARQGIDAYCDKTPEVTVTGGATTTPNAQVLDHVGARFLGTVTDTSGKPLKDISVTPYPVGSSTTEFYGAGNTRSSGRFNRNQIEPGTWQLKLSDYRGIWETTWFDSTARSDAQVFTLAEGTVVKGLTVKLKSTAKLRVKATPGTRKATFTIDVTRRATGSRPSGKVTVSLGDASKTVSVKKGVAKVTLTGLPAGKRTFAVAYQGTSSTADAATKVTARIR